MPEKVEVKSVSPFLQELLTERIKSALAARDKGDYLLYADRLRIVVLLAPSNVKSKISSKLSLLIDEDDPLDFLENVVGECVEKEQEYVPSLDHRKAVRACWENALEKIDIVLGAIMEALHEEGIYSEVRRLESHSVW